MKAALLLFAVMGSALAFTPGMEYKYKYEGRLGMGIPEVRNKYSGLGIKALITLQVQDQNVVIIKLDNVLVGEYVGEAGVQVTNALPIQYSPLQGHGHTLEEPFKVYLNKDKDEVMVVPQSDQEWIVNLRKSVVQLFLIEPITGNVNLKDLSNDAFTTTEPTIFGTCFVDYAITPFTQSSSTEKTMAESGKDNTYMLKRTVNFDNCDERVRLMHASVGNFNGVSNNIYKNIASRSSMMTMKIAGKGGNYMIIEGNVQGYYSVNPFGVPTEKLMSLTNQDIILESVTHISHKMDVTKPTRPVNTFYMEVASPYAPPANPTSFINYYNKKDVTYSPMLPVTIVTGIPLSHDYTKKLQNKLDNLIQECANLMLSVGPVPQGKISPLNTHPGKLTTMLDVAVEVSQGIDVQNLEQLFEKYYNDKSEQGEMKLKLFIDVCAASGASAPLKVILNEIQKDKITAERIATIFITLSNNFVATPVLPDIMKYVKTLDVKTNPMMTTNVLINFATIVKKVCVNKDSVSTQIYGREECDISLITEDFIPFLKHKFDNARDSYEKVVYVQALSNLGTAEVVNVISPIITGHNDATVKEVAILALKYSIIGNVVNKDDVFNLLMPIVHNVNEDALLRQYAIGVLVSWRPSPSWWYRLAISTWQEPSNSVGSFIYYLIKYNSFNAKDTQESKIAQFVFPLTKSFPPVSSYSLKYDKEYSDDYSNLLINSIVLNDDESSIPHVLYTIVKTNIGGINFPFVEAAYSTSSVSDSSSGLIERFSKITSNELLNILRSAPNRRAEEILHEIKSQVESYLKPNTDSQQQSIFAMKFFENLQMMIPVSHKMDSFLNSGTWNFLQSLLKGKSLQFSKFVNPTPFMMFLPTELGVPFIAKMSTPTVQSAEGEVKISFGNKGTTSFLDFLSFKSVAVDLTTNYKFASKVITEFQTILPWNEKMITSGVETMKSVTLPMKLQISFENQDIVKNISLAFMPTYQKEHAAVYVSNIPYVARKNMYPGEIMSEYEKYETISVEGTEKGMNQHKMIFDKEMTGLDAAIVYEGDIPFPFTSGTFYDNFEHPYKMISKIVSPTAKLFASALLVNFGSSETKAVYPSITFTMPTYYTDQANNPDEDETKEFAFRVLTTGTKSRYYESYFHSKVVSKDSNVKKTQINYRNVQQFATNKPQMYCIQIESQQPVSYNFRTLLTIMTSQNADYSFTGKVKGGSSCNQAQFATVKGVFKLSEDKKNTIIDEVTKELNINKDSTATFEEMPFYDQTSIAIQYKQNLPSFFTNVSNKVYDTLRGSQFPYIYSNYDNVQNPKGKVTFDGERNVDGTWNLKAQLPTENVEMEHFDLPFVCKMQLYFYGQNVFLY